MKYYGFTYNGCADKYDVSTMQAYQSAYEALRAANHEWSANPDNQIARLLLVIRMPESGEATQENDRAYFQFRDADSVKAFIDGGSEIIWSNDDEPIGNGNFKIMW